MQPQVLGGKMKKLYAMYSVYLMPIISFFIIGAALESVMCYGISLYMINCSINTLFSRYAVTVSIAGDSVFDFGDIHDASIFRSNKDQPFSAYEIVCSDGRLNVGNGIKVDDNMIGTNSAVIGSEVGSFIDLSELVIDDKKYDIKDEFNDKRVPSNNCTVFYFGDSICETKDSEFIIDGKNKKAVLSALEQLKAKADKYGVVIENVENNKVSVRNFISSGRSLPLLFILYFSVLGFNDVMICIFHTEQLKRTITVNILLGKSRPFGVMFRSLLMFMPISAGASAVIVRSFIGNSRDVAYSFFMTVLFLGVINTAVSLIYKHKFTNKDSEILKELCND